MRYVLSVLLALLVLLVSGCSEHSEPLDPVQSEIDNSDNESGRYSAMGGRFSYQSIGTLGVEPFYYIKDNSTGHEFLFNKGTGCVRIDGPSDQGNMETSK